jgi:hypothetical protein
VELEGRVRGSGRMLEGYVCQIESAKVLPMAEKVNDLMTQEALSGAGWLPPWETVLGEWHRSPHCGEPFQEIHAQKCRYIHMHTNPYKY